MRAPAPRKVSFAALLGFVIALALVSTIPSSAAETRALAFPQGVQDALGPEFRANPHVLREPTQPKHHDTSPRGMLHHWNGVAVDASGLDHTPVADGEVRTFGEQLGPTRASRAMAIVHIAVFDAVNAIAGRYRSYTGLPAAPRTASMEAAIAQAAHDTLSALFPSQKAAYDAQLEVDLAAIRDKQAMELGIDLGRRAAAAILAMRANDGSAHAEPRVGIEFITDTGPGSWRQDPVSRRRSRSAPTGTT